MVRGKTFVSIVLSVLVGCSGTDDAADPASTSSGFEFSSVRAYLATPVAERGDISSEPFANTPLSREEAEKMGRMFVEQMRKDMRKSRLHEEYAARAVAAEGKTMKFDVQRFGAAPPDGHSLYLSMHGGGGTPAAFNDEQWENQILRLGDTSIGYRTAFDEGIYVAPRAPTDEWDMWFQEHVDDLLDRLIHAALLFEDVDPNRVYLLGYSAGGDGAFRLGNRMADRFAAVSMAAGHPREVNPLNLRNVAFQMQGGKQDAAYDRHLEIPGFSRKLDALQEEDPKGYVHQLVMWDTGHNFADWEAIGWITEHRRDPLPSRVVWHEDGSDRRHFYWLATQAGDAGRNAVVAAERSGNSYAIEASGYRAVVLRFNDDLANLDEEITVTVNGDTRFEAPVERTGATLWRTLHERMDESYMFSAEVRIEGL